MDFAGVDEAAASCAVDEFAAVGADGERDSGRRLQWQVYGHLLSAKDYPGQSRSSCNRFGLVWGHSSQLSAMLNRAQLIVGPPPMNVFSMM